MTVKSFELFHKSHFHQSSAASISDDGALFTSGLEKILRNHEGKPEKI